MSESILLIDDEEMILDSLRMILSQEGYAVDCARNGGEALDILKTHTYDLVITDIRMPGMSGLEVVERVKASLPDQKVMMITGYGSLETAVKAQHRGVCDYLLKPFNLQDLKRSVRRAVDAAGCDRAAPEKDLESKLQQASDYFILLADFTAALNTSLEVQELMHATLDRLRSIGETGYASLALLPDVLYRLYYLKSLCDLPELADGMGISAFVLGSGQQFFEPVQITAGPDPPSPDPLHTVVRHALVHEGIKHAYLLPIMVKDVFVGMVDVCSNTSEGFTLTDRALIHTVVGQMSLALTRAFSYQEVEERSRQISFLYNLSLKLNQSLKITDSIKAICEGAADITGADGTLLQTSLEAGAIKNALFQKDTGFHQEMHCGAHDWFIVPSARKEAFVSQDPLLDPRVNSLALASLGLRSLAYVPLICDWDDLGGLTVFLKTEGRRFDERDLHLLHLFARHASEALLNAQLFEAIRVSREQIIHEKNKMDIVLDTMADGVVTLDSHCRVTYLNNAMLRMLGCTPDKAIGRLCHEVFCVECRFSTCPVRNADGHAAPDPFETSIRTASRESLPVRMSLAPVRTGNGAVSAWVKVIRSVPQEQKAATPRSPAA